MNTPRTARLLAALPLLLAACADGADDGWRGSLEMRADSVFIARNPAEGSWREGEAWRVEEDLRIGVDQGGGPTHFGDIAAVEADSAGHLYVLDRQAREIRVFDAAGRYVRTIGRAGGGPGELRDPIALAWAPDGALWVVDPGAGRYTSFDRNGIFANEHRRWVTGHALPWHGGFGEDGGLYEIAVVAHRGGMPRPALLRMDGALEPADTFPLPARRGEQFELRRGDGTTAAAVPFAPGQVWALDPRGYVWTGVSDRYRLAQLTPRGDTARIVEREAAAVPVTAAERDAALAELRWFTDQGGRVDAGRIPGRKPAFEQVVVDGTRGIWVRPSLPAGHAGAAFDVFDAEGRYRGRVALPGGLDAHPAPVIRNGALYGVVRDSLDVQRVVRARIIVPAADAEVRAGERDGRDGAGD